MMNRSIAVLLCLLYLSVSTVFAAVHHHEDASTISDGQCAACTWHHQSNVDAPGVAPIVVRPEIAVSPAPFSDVLFRELSVRLHPSRGPPVPLL